MGLDLTIYKHKGNESLEELWWNVDDYFVETSLDTEIHWFGNEGKKLLRAIMVIKGHNLDSFEEITDDVSEIFDEALSNCDELYSELYTEIKNKCLIATNKGFRIIVHISC